MYNYHRRSIRLVGWDYSNVGMYFITICVQDMECLFGEIKDGKMFLNCFGEIVKNKWFKTPKIRKNFGIDEFVIMPNHFHGIVVILEKIAGANGANTNGANCRSPLPMRMKPKSLSSFMAGFKSTITKQINVLRKMPGEPVWQRNYYEHIIRNEEELFAIRNYIKNNPSNWDKDKNNRNNLLSRGERPLAPTAY